MASDGAACGSGGLSGSAVGLMLRVVSVSCVLSLSFAVLGLGVASAAVEAMVVMSEGAGRRRGGGRVIAWRGWAVRGIERQLLGHP